MKKREDPPKKREVPPEEEPLRADAARNRDRVLSVARKLLAHGDSSLQMNQIARSAGVGVGTVYRHFPTRQDLLEALVNEHLEALLEEARKGQESDDPRAGLQRFLRAVLALQLADVGLAEVVNAPKDAQSRTSQLKAGLIGAIQRMLGRAQRAGVVRDDIGAEDIQRLMCGVEHAARIGSEPLALGERYLTILLEGLRPASG
ncbi:TetR/AcrR family transcriptional regulator [Hyalangium versicolor]|uniref:TetR/AcrR family transcriptional regulator n=1 Tax=Hyalangium versicolor TaxID=2861190 RepID=UPI001CD007C7|nr:TetR/AcrR family transcriptional regulator [Hyalangium versicolor]